MVRMMRSPTLRPDQAALRNERRLLAGNQRYSRISASTIGVSGLKAAGIRWISPCLRSAPPLARTVTLVGVNDGVATAPAPVAAGGYGTRNAPMRELRRHAPQTTFAASPAAGRCRSTDTCRNQSRQTTSHRTQQPQSRCALAGRQRPGHNRALADESRSREVATPPATQSRPTRR